MEEEMLKEGKNQNRTKQGAFLLILGILLFASNLRAPLTSVGALVPSIRDSLGVSNAAVGVITTLPLLAFAFVSPFSPKVASRFGMEKTIFFSMILLLIGMMLRSVTDVATLFIGTALIGIAISFGNVLLPGYIKLSFPFKVGIITAFYTVFMNVFGALAAGVSVPLSEIGGFGWQGALAAWGLLVLIAIIIWFPQFKNIMQRTETNPETISKKTTMWKSFTAWQVTIFMGFQSLMFYTPMTWLPDILQLNGYSLAEAGWLLSLMQASLVPVTFITPIIADKMNNQKLLGVLTGVLFILGVLGLLSGQQALIIISVILIGAGCGSGFSLSMMLFTLRTKDGYEASELSGMAQSIGYLFAAAGPVLFGGLHDVTGSWFTPLIMLIVVSAVVLITGYLAGRRIVINE